MKKIFIHPTQIDTDIINEGVNYLRQGKIVALPTDTVYGLACSSNNPEAIERLYMVKQRPKDKPFTLAVHSAQKVVQSYFAPMPPFGYRLIENFWPGPLTIIYYTPEDKKIGIRVPDHKVTQDILETLATAVCLPSANISDEPEAISAAEVESVFGETIDLIVDGGKCAYGRPSTVIDLTYHPFKILRQGVVTEQEVVEVFIKKRILFVCTGNTCRSPMAHCLLQKHLDQTRPYLKDRYEINSCGIQALPGMPVSTSVVEILKDKEGLDITGAVAQPLHRQTLRSSDFIFVMDESHRTYILSFDPTVEGRVFTLKQFLPPELEKDITDPIGQGYQYYEETYFIIKEAIKELIEWL